MYDEDPDDQWDFIGNFECMLNKLLTAHNQTLKDHLVLKNTRAGSRGRIILTAHSVEQSNNMAKMDIVCRIVDFKNKNKKGFLCFCKPPEDNPKLVIERQGEALEGTNKIKWVQVYESEVMIGNVNP